MLTSISLTRITLRRLIAAAAVLHVCLAVALFVAGRSAVAPAIVDRDGIVGSFAFDSYDYQRGATDVAALIRSGQIRAAATAAQPLHVKMIAVCFALLSPLLGYSTLSAEPYNLACYLAIIAIVFAFARELRDERAGVLAAAVVALWPTFLLHTLQLLKDAFFIAAALAFLLCAVTLLTRTYRQTMAVSVSTVAIVLVLLLTLVRFSFVLLMIAVALLTLALLILRQVRERRLLFWNMAPALVVLLIALALLPLHSPHNIQRTKQFLPAQAGPLKNTGDPAMQVTTLVTWVAGNELNHTAAKTSSSRSDRFVRGISRMRSRFAAVYFESGSLVDKDTEFRNAGDLIRYVPRAMAIGLWAPFPQMWLSPGRRVGNLGKLLAGVETFFIYFLELLSVVALVREPRQVALWFVLAIIVFGVTALAFVIPNVGAIYRFRYLFWMLLIVAAMTGLTALLARQRQGKTFKRLLVATSIAVLLAPVFGCSSLGQSPQSQAITADQVIPHFAFTNFTGTSFRALYLSPTTATGWQENVLAGTELKDGDTLDVQVDPNGKQVEWDLKVEGIDGHYAEWKNLKLDGASEITLVWKLSSTPVVVAEVE